MTTCHLHHGDHTASSRVNQLGRHIRIVALASFIRAATKEIAAEKADDDATLAAQYAVQRQLDAFYSSVLSHLAPPTRELFEHDFQLGNRRGARLTDDGVYLYAVLPRSVSRVQIFVNTGDYELNQVLYATLQLNKADIERRFGQPLEWTPPEGRATAKIELTLCREGFQTTVDSESLGLRVSDALQRLYEAVSPQIQSLETAAEAYYESTEP